MLEVDFPFMLHVKFAVVDRIQPLSDKFAKGVENKATGDSKLINSPARVLVLLQCPDLLKILSSAFRQPTKHLL